MPIYAILQNPGHNRVYFKAARAMAYLELRLAGNKMTSAPANVREELIGGLPYLLFDTEVQLADKDLFTLSRLSFVYGIFEWHDKKLLKPLEKNPEYYFESDDITTILKYNGKTNELFTRMLLNIAAFSTQFEGPLNVLDPLCGKGTTIFESLLCGHNAYGVETDSKLVHEAYTFLKKYLENAKYKHSVHQERQGMKNYTATHYQVKLNRSKADDPLSAEFISGDTRDVKSFYRKNTFHAIVGDLPYGVQHGSKRGKNEKSRNSLPMLAEALPGWHRVLKPGGVFVCAWNLFLMNRQEIEEALEAEGFALTMAKDNRAFVHRVDNAINRDVVVGLKK